MRVLGTTEVWRYVTRRRVEQSGLDRFGNVGGWSRRWSQRITTEGGGLRFCSETAQGRCTLAARSFKDGLLRHGGRSPVGIDVVRLHPGEGRYSDHFPGTTPTFRYVRHQPTFFPGSHMKKIILAGAFALALSFDACASSYQLQNEAAASEEVLDAISAPIRTRAQLDAYLAVTPNSPIHRLGEAKMKTFLASLMFSPRGLGSYSSVELEGMHSSEVYSILALFGLQTTTRAVRTRRATTEDDNRVERRLRRSLPPTRGGAACLVHKGGSSHVCERLEGAVCSYLCRTH